MRIQVDDPDSTMPDGLVPVEIINGDLASVVQAPMTLGKPMDFELPPGTYAVRAYLPSGGTAHQQFSVSEDDVTEISLPGDDSSLLESVVQSWSGLEAKTNFHNRETLAELRDGLRSIPLLRDLFGWLSASKRSPLSNVWVRLWQREHDRWDLVSWEPTSRSEEGTADGFGTSATLNLPDGQHYLQIGGVSQNWRLFALPSDEALVVSFGYDMFRQDYDRVLVSVRRSNSASESLLDFLVRGSLQQAGVVSRAVNAEELLYGKERDPMAATIAAYYLLRVGELDHVSQWAANLADWFEWLPDGAVIHGWCLLQTRQPDAAIERFLSAWQRGVPIYSEGLRLLFDGLRMFETDPERKGKEVGVALEAIRPYVLSADLSMPTTSFAGTDPSSPTISPVKGSAPGAASDAETVYVSGV